MGREGEDHMEEKLYTCGTTEYKLETVDGVICLTDLDVGMTITNNAQSIIAQLNENGFDLLHCPVVYCDTTGTWDWLKVDLQGNFAGFQHIGADRHRDHAVQAVKEFTQIRPR
jgi:hypothetical protein